MGVKDHQHDEANIQKQFGFNKAGRLRESALS